MPFRLEPGEPLERGLRRIVLEEIDATHETLDGRGAPGEDPVHEARKSCKKIRAVLRLGRLELGETAYARENRVFGDIGRALSTSRDSTVLFDTLDDLLERTEARKTRTGLWALRGWLGRAGEAATDERGIEPLLVALRDARSRSAGWQLARAGFDSIQPGLEKTYAAGRRNARRCRKDPSDHRMHEWRKRVKQLWYQIRLLEPTRPEELATLAESLRNLQQRLGEDHDLALLIDAAGRTTDWAGRKKRHRVVRLAGRRRDEVRSGLWRLSKSVYKRKPARFVQRLERPREETLERDAASDPEAVIAVEVMV